MGEAILAICFAMYVYAVVVIIHFLFASPHARQMDRLRKYTLQNHSLICLHQQRPLLVVKCANHQRRLCFGTEMHAEGNGCLPPLSFQQFSTKFRSSQFNLTQYCLNDMQIQKKKNEMYDLCNNLEILDQLAFQTNSKPSQTKKTSFLRGKARENYIEINVAKVKIVDSVWQRRKVREAFNSRIWKNVDHLDETEPAIT